VVRGDGIVCAVHAPVGTQGSTATKIDSFFLACWHANLADSVNNPKQGACNGRKKEVKKSNEKNC
jgi:hypothetical protein